MPQVPVLSERRITPQGIPNARVQEGVSPGAFGAQFGAALMESGRDLAGIAQHERDKADNAAVLEAENGLDSWESGALFDARTGAFTKRGKDAFDLPNQVLPQFDKEAKRIEEGLGSDRAKGVYRQRAQQRRAFIEKKLNQHESGEREQYYDAQDKAGIESSRGAAANFYNAPERIAAEIGKQEAVIEAHGARKGWSADQTGEAKRVARSGTHTDVIERYLARGEWRRGSTYFEAVREQIGADDATRIEANLTAARRQAENEAKASMAEARYALSERVQDATAAAMYGLEVPDAPTRAEFVAAWGPEQGNGRYESFTRTLQTGADLRGMALMSPQEQADLLAKRAPAQTEGAADAAQAHRMLASQAEQLNRQRDADPAAYVTKYSPRIAAAWQASLQSPEAARNYATATLAEQERLGVRRPKVLPDQVASAIAQSFHSVNGEGVVDLIATEQQKWGSYWPRVFGELAAKKIPPAALAIGRGMEPGAAVRLATVAALPLDELVKGVEAPPADIRESIVPKMADFQRSLDGVVGGENTFAGMYDAVQRLTYSYLRSGRGLNDSVGQAYNEVVGDHYGFRDVNGHTFRVPAQEDNDDVERGAQMALDAVSSSDLATPLPTSTSSAENAVSDLAQTIRKRGYWVTSADGETGLALFLDGSPVLRADGSVYAMTWEQLRALPAGVRAVEEKKVQAEGELALKLRSTP